jgi:hypothetical protein
VNERQPKSKIGVRCAILPLARFALAACALCSLCHTSVVLGQMEYTPMSIESHLNELVRRHQAIEEAILAEESHPASDDIKIHELKVRKLHIKDQIERLRLEARTAAAH